MAHVLYNKAYQSLEEHDISTAFKYLKQSLVYYADDIEALNLAGICSFLLCDFSAAHTYWKRSIEIDDQNNRAKKYIEYLISDSFKTLLNEYNLSIESISNKRYEEAIEHIEKIIEKEPDLVEPYIILGLCCYKLKDYNKAMKYWRNAGTRDTGNAKVKSYMLCLQEEMGSDKTKDSLSSEKALNKNKTLSSSLKLKVTAFASTFALAAVFISTGYWLNNYKNASLKIEYDRAIQTIAMKDEIIENQENMIKNNKKLNQDNLIEKQQIMDKLNEVMKEYEELKNNLGKHQTSGQHSDYPDYGEKITLFIQDEYATFNEAIQDLKRGEYNQSLQKFEAILQYGIEENLVAESLFFTASIYEKEENITEAVARYMKYIQMYSDRNYYDDSLYNCGLLLYRSGKKDEAATLLKKLVNEKPESIFNNSRVQDILSKLIISINY